MKPTVRILGTGGTIANTADGRIGLDSLIEDIENKHPPGLRLSDHARIDTREVIREGSEVFGLAEWLKVGMEVARSAADPDIDGLVVTHGTFTVEETSYFVHLVANTHKPIVFTCSQRKHGMVGNDGDRNLIDAVRVAASAEAAGGGVLVVVNEEIHSARDVRKMNRLTSGFSSGIHGILGRVDSDRVTITRISSRRHTAGSEFTVGRIDVLPRVDVVATYAGADGAAVPAFVEAGARGLVVNGFAYNGAPHRDQVSALETASRMGVVVVLVNRGMGGRVPIVPGDRFVRGEDLSAQKARVLLCVALTRFNDVDEVQRIFSEY